MIKRKNWRKGLSGCMAAFLMMSMLNGNAYAAENISENGSNIEVAVMDQQEPVEEVVIGDEQNPGTEAGIGDELNPEADVTIGDELDPETEVTIEDEMNPEEGIIDDEQGPVADITIEDDQKIAAEYYPAILIDEGNFPDIKFREYVLEYNDLDKNGMLTQDEVLKAEYVSVNEEGIHSLKGIEYLTEIKGLSCKKNYLRELDLTNNKKLEYIYCDENQLRKLNITGLDRLEIVWCGYNAIKSLDVSTNTKLDKLDADYNQLTMLDVSNNPNLTRLYCSNNFITQITFPKSPKLVILDVSYNQLTSIKVNFPTLHGLDVESNHLTSLNVASCSELSFLRCGWNELTSLDVSDKPLDYLYCEFNRLKKLVLTNCVELYSLYAEGNCLTQLDANTCKKLHILYCQNNPLTSLRIDKCSNLESLLVNNSQLPYVKVHKDATTSGTFYYEPGIYFATGTRNSSGYLQYDLSNIEGFDTSKVYNLSGGRIEGNTLVVDDKEVTYNYRSGNGKFTDTKYRIRVTENSESYYFYNGALYIKHKGDMPDYSNEDGNRAPWYYLKDKVYAVEFVGGATTSIGDYAFYGMPNLARVTGTNNIRSIGDYALAESGLTYYQCSEGLRTIGKSAFKNCTKWEETTLSFDGHIESIGADAFKGCSKLTKVKWYSNKSRENLYEWYLINFENAYSNPLSATSKTELIYNSMTPYRITDVEVPVWIGEINAYAFANYTYLKSVTFTPGIRKIGSKAFSNCSSLKNVYFLGNAPTVSSSAFNGVTAKVGYSPSFWDEDKRLDYGGTLTWSNKDKITITSQPADVNADENQKVTFSVVAEGYNLSYQWQYSTNQGKTWKNVTSASGKTANYSFTTKDTQNGRQHRCRMQNAYGTIKYSKVAELTLGAPIEITTQPQVVSAIEGDKAVFSITATGDTLSYQWQYSKDGGTTWTTPTTTSSKTAKYSVTASKSNNDMKARCVITDRFGKIVTSKTATLTVRLLAKITSQPKDATGRVGEKATFAVKASGEVNGYQWHYSEDGGKTWSVAKAESATTAKYSYTIKDTHDGRLARCVVKGPDGREVTSEAAKLTLLPDIVITTQPANKSVTEGQSVSFYVAATGAELTYQWQQSIDQGKNWLNISGATAAKYSFTAKKNMNGYQYRCRIQDKNSYVKNTNAAVLTVQAAIQIVTQPTAQTVTEGEKATFTVKATGTELSYQWQVSKDEGKSWMTPGAASSKTSKYEVVAKIAQNGYLVKCVITDAQGRKLESDSVRLTVNTGSLAIISQPTNQTVKAGEQASFQVKATGGGLKYQWLVSTDGGKKWITPNATSAKTAEYRFITKISQNGYLLKCVVMDESANSVESNVALLTVQAGASEKEPEGLPQEEDPQEQWENIEE